MARLVARFVVSDASPLIGLAIVQGLPWLPALFGAVWIPPSVPSQVLPGVGSRGEADIATAIKRRDLRLWRKAIKPSAHDVLDLDAGETDCIRIALTQSPGNALLLKDERAGRAAAAELRIAVAGTAAVIGLAKNWRLIDSAKACFERLHGTDFRIGANVIQTVLREVGEL